MTQATWSPDVTPLGASTLSRKWLTDVDISAPGSASPVWARLRGVTEFSPSDDPETQDDSDYDSRGFKSEIQTALGWGMEVTVARKATRENGDEYDPAQEFLRSKAYRTGTDNQVHIRYYEWNGATGPKVQAYEGYASVSWEEQGGDMTELSTAKVTLTGQGQRLEIAHPAGA